MNYINKEFFPQAEVQLVFLSSFVSKILCHVTGSHHWPRQEGFLMGSEGHL